MAVLKSILGVILCALMTYALQAPILLTEPIQISPYFEQLAFSNDVSNFPGARDCGGAGRLIKIGHDQCLSGGSTPCAVPANGVGRTEMVFVPSASTRGLGVTIRIITDGDTKTYENFLPEVSVVAGREYIMAGSGGASQELKGKHVITQVEIFRMVDRQVESCGELESVVL